ncbi:hypothetical protein BDK51DRAFT_31820 [Blyttiomyces helicus]|uniref:Uncharacterized protein n=1 Tax=Blyttiomyces helicus TaxID=388810 RepID=A0A4P9WIG9_9FUNG|nr:hypothetical protein BDK51DRAFT_31820 [Blyttiomyces helicus]|eukprot:RKO92574.1 hypothetical protein BDK51DRAFT_31820 [Blyttiomyces helicus]
MTLDAAASAPSSPSILASTSASSTSTQRPASPPAPIRLIASAPQTSPPRRSPAGVSYPAARPTDVIHLQLTDRHLFRVSAAILGLFPESVTSILFPNGTVLLYSCVDGAQASTTVAATREAANLAAKDRVVAVTRRVGAARRAAGQSNRGLASKNATTEGRNRSPDPGSQAASEGGTLDECAPNVSVRRGDSANGLGGHDRPKWESLQWQKYYQAGGVPADSESDDLESASSEDDYIEDEDRDEVSSRDSVDGDLADPKGTKRGLRRKPLNNDGFPSRRHSSPNFDPVAYSREIDPSSFTGPQYMIASADLDPGVFRFLLEYFRDAIIKSNALVEAAIEERERLEEEGRANDLAARTSGRPIEKEASEGPSATGIVRDPLSPTERRPSSVCGQQLYADRRPSSIGGVQLSTGGRQSAAGRRQSNAGGRQSIDEPPMEAEADSEVIAGEVAGSSTSTPEKGADSPPSPGSTDAAAPSTSASSPPTPAEATPTVVEESDESNGSRRASQASQTQSLREAHSTSTSLKSTLSITKLSATQSSPVTRRASSASGASGPFRRRLSSFTESVIQLFTGGGPGPTKEAGKGASNSTREPDVVQAPAVIPKPKHVPPPPNVSRNVIVLREELTFHVIPATLSLSRTPDSTFASPTGGPDDPNASKASIAKRASTTSAPGARRSIRDRFAAVTQSLSSIASSFKGRAGPSTSTGTGSMNGENAGTTDGIDADAGAAWPLAAPLDGEVLHEVKRRCRRDLLDRTHITEPYALVIHDLIKEAEQADVAASEREAREAAAIQLAAVTGRLPEAGGVHDPVEPRPITPSPLSASPESLPPADRPLTSHLPPPLDRASLPRRTSARVMFELEDQIVHRHLLGALAAFADMKPERKWDYRETEAGAGIGGTGARICSIAMIDIGDLEKARERLADEERASVGKFAGAEGGGGGGGEAAAAELAARNAAGGRSTLPQGPGASTGVSPPRRASVVSSLTTSTTASRFQTTGMRLSTSQYKAIPLDLLLMSSRAVVACAVDSNSIQQQLRRAWARTSRRPPFGVSSSTQRRATSCPLARMSLYEAGKERRVEAMDFGGADENSKSDGCSGLVGANEEASTFFAVRATVEDELEFQDLGVEMAMRGVVGGAATVAGGVGDLTRAGGGAGKGPGAAGTGFGATGSGDTTLTAVNVDPQGTGVPALRMPEKPQGGGDSTSLRRRFKCRPNFAAPDTATHREQAAVVVKPLAQACDFFGQRARCGEGHDERAAAFLLRASLRWLNVLVVLGAEGNAEPERRVGTDEARGDACRVSAVHAKIAHPLHRDRARVDVNSDEGDVCEPRAGERAEVCQVHGDRLEE